MPATPRGYVTAPLIASVPLRCCPAQVGTIVEEEYLADGTRVVAYVPPSLRARLAPDLVASPRP